MRFKKSIVSVLILSFILVCLSACGTEKASDSKQESIDISKAISATPTKVYDDVKDNEARAKQNVYRVTGAIDSIKGDYLTIDSLKVYLPSSDLANMSKGNTITFVGTISNVSSESVEMGGGLHTTTCIEFENVILE